MLRRLILDKFFFKFLPKKKFVFGKGCVTRYTLFEFRNFCSIYFHHVETFEQDRFHTHAFNALVWILRGGYNECVKQGVGPNKPVKCQYFKAGDWRWIPRELNHKLLEAKPDSVSLLIAGPYSSIWTEELDNGDVKVITKHQKILYQGPQKQPQKCTLCDSTEDVEYGVCKKCDVVENG
jgi:hypothetical protein